MAEADVMYKKYVSQTECCLKNDYNIFKTLDKIGLVNIDEEKEDDGEKDPTLKKQSSCATPNAELSAKSSVEKSV